MFIEVLTSAIAAGAGVTVTVVSQRIHARRDSVDLAVEFHRAGVDYRQLLEHRLANPLTIIEGAAHTLLADNVSDPQLRRQLLNSIIAQTQRLRMTTLRPTDQLGIEERCFAPEPASAGLRAPILHLRHRGETRRAR